MISCLTVWCKWWSRVAFNHHLLVRGLRGIHVSVTGDERGHWSELFVKNAGQRWARPRLQTKKSINNLWSGKTRNLSLRDKLSTQVCCYCHVVEYCLWAVGRSCLHTWSDFKVVINMISNYLTLQMFPVSFTLCRPCDLVLLVESWDMSFSIMEAVVDSLGVFRTQASGLSVTLSLFLIFLGLLYWWVTIL